MVTKDDIRLKLKTYINERDEIVLSSKPLYGKRPFRQPDGSPTIQEVQTGTSVVSVSVSIFYQLFKGILEDDVIDDKLTAIRDTPLAEKDGQPLKHGYEGFMDKLIQDGITL